MGVARCGQGKSQDYPLVKFAKSIGKSTQDLRLRDMVNFMTGKGGRKMVFKAGEPKPYTKCERCGVQGVLFTKVNDEFFCTSNCAPMVEVSRRRGIHWTKPQGDKEAIAMAKKNLEEKKNGNGNGEGTEKEEKGKKEKGKKQSSRGEHLIPKEPVKFPKELFKHPKIGKNLKVLSECDRSSREGARARLALRKEGFKLSEEETWKKFLKDVK